MKYIEKQLKKLDGYLISMTRDTVKGNYELEVGIPRGWVYKSNDIIECEEVNKNDNGTLLKIKPKEEDVAIDDLFEFVNLIIETNAKIVEKEKEFNERMENYKKELEEQAKKFYEELDVIKEKSFVKFDKPKTANSVSEGDITDTANDSTKSKPGRPKRKKTVKSEVVDEKTTENDN